MKLILLCLFLSFWHTDSYGSHITIISSQSDQTGQTMDSIWFKVALKMGHMPKIVLQSTLDNQNFFNQTDLLIISNAEIGLSALATETILQFIKTGKPVYIQSEYLPNFTTNQAFAYIIKMLGGSFEWGKELSGNISLRTLGIYGNTNNKVDSIICWYSLAGHGDCTTINFLEYGGEYHGWHFIPQNPSYGSISSIADQDWIREEGYPLMMENIITNLISPPTLPAAYQLNIGRDTMLCAGETLLLDASLPNGSYRWNDNTTLPVLTIMDEGLYKVNVDLECGTLIDSIHVDIIQCHCKLYKPNIFSTSSTTGNNQFSFTSNCPIEQFHLSIFDRWGDLVFESENVANSWDGMVSGKTAPAGVYTYLLEYRFSDNHLARIYNSVSLVH